MKRILSGLLGISMSASPVEAGVARIEVESREVIAGGAEFGAFGAYERLAGTVHFEFDPDNPSNSGIVDIDLAPRNGRGLVEAHANFLVYQPADPNRRRGAALLEVSNRGGQASMVYFNAAPRGRSIPITDPSHFGDGFLFRHGITLAWVGWQWDVPGDETRFRLHVPIATSPDGPIEGLVRADWTVDERAASLQVSHRGHIAYPVGNSSDSRNVLTVRDGRLAPRRIIPRDQWRFARVNDGVESPDPTWITLEGGFEADHIYELVYVARGPRVAGLGPAAIRDFASSMKYDEACPFGVEHALAIGISQTGRFLRLYLHQGFNTDEQGRMALDGLMIHTAGAGRGSFNHRFAQPSRDGHRYSTFFYPTDLFPFSGRVQTDPMTGTTDGLLANQRDEAHIPRVFYTNTGYEYWGRAGALLHVEPSGRRDVAPLPQERIYHLASGQHFVPPFRPEHAPSPIVRGNPLDFLVNMRALLIAMVAWIEDEVPPPASRFPRIDRDELVELSELELPEIPGLGPPRAPHEAYRLDFGSSWDDGVITRQPPDVGGSFPALVPQVDDLGNEVGGVRNVEVRVPVASFLPWRTRGQGRANPDELEDFWGSVCPLPRDAEARRSTGDSRQSIEELYESKDDYLVQCRVAARALVEEGFLLEEDVDRVLARASALWDWVAQ